MQAVSSGRRNSESVETDLTRRDVLALAALGLAAGAPGIAVAAAPSGQLTYAIHVSLAPTWFDPAETEALITPYMVLYALHDAMVKPMPGKPQAPCLAESWSASPDGLSYEFVLRKGLKFHNGEPVTADDVKFSFERYHGAAHQLMKDNVAAIELLDPQHVRFKLKSRGPTLSHFITQLPAPVGSCPRSMSNKSATTASRSRRSARAPTNSYRSSPASSWCSKHSTTIGASLPM